MFSLGAGSSRSSCSGPIEMLTCEPPSTSSEQVRSSAAVNASEGLASSCTSAPPAAPTVRRIVGPTAILPPPRAEAPAFAIAFVDEMFSTSDPLKVIPETTVKLARALADRSPPVLAEPASSTCA